MIFLRPEFLWLALIWLPLIIFWYRRASRGGWDKVIDPTLLRALTTSTKNKRRFQLAIPATVLLLGTLALAGPAMERDTKTATGLSNLYVILDTTLSMSATDIEPDRITRAKRTIVDWATSGLFEKTSVYVYSGSAHNLTPLTGDAKTIELQLQALNPFLMPQLGNRPELAFQMVAESLNSVESVKPHLLWLTDDVSELNTRRIKPFVPPHLTATLIPFGTQSGSPMPIPGDQGFVTENDEVVIVKTDLSQIKEHAAELGFRVAELGSLPNPMTIRASSSDASTQLRWQDLGYWLLFPIIAVWLWRGKQLISVAASVLLLLALPEPSYAFDLFKNSEQKAYQALLEGEYEQALDYSNEAMIRGEAQFGQQNFEEAITEFQLSGSADALYNIGNTYAQQGKFKEAIASYDRALALADHANAKANKEKVEAFLEQQQQGEPGEEGNEGEQGDPQQNEENQQSADSSNDSDSEAANQSESSPSEPSESETEQPTSEQDNEERNDGEESAEQDVQEQGLDPEALREQQNTEAVLNQLTPPTGSVLQQKFRYQLQQNPIDSDGSTW